MRIHTTCVLCLIFISEFILFPCVNPVLADDDSGWVPVTGTLAMMVSGSSFIPEPSLIAAFGPGGESDCRGITEIIMGSPYHLPVVSDAEGEEISFKIWYPETDKAVSLTETVPFETNTFCSLDIHPDMIDEGLSFTSVYPTLGETNRNLSVTLTGTGFDATTRVSMYLDTGRKRAILGALEIEGEAWDVSVSGNYAYVAGNMGLHIIDISDSANPVLISSVSTPGWANRMAISRGIAYIADESGTLEIINISNPYAPKPVTSVAMPGPAQGIAVTDAGIAYIVEDGEGLVIVDVSTPSKPEVITSLFFWDYAYDIVVEGNMAYLAMGSAGLQVIDISDSSAPEMLGTVAADPFAHSVAVSDDKAYMANVKDYFSTGSRSHLQIIDVTDPSSPELLSTLETPGDAAGVCVAGDTVYVTDGGTGLQIIDAANPYDPVIVGTVDTPGVALWGVTVINHIAYVADGAAGLQIIDIGEPEVPPVIGAVETGDQAVGILLDGETVYVADGYSGLQVINISDPSAPEIIASVDTLGNASQLAVKENILYVTDAEAGVQIIAVSDPANPTRINAVNTPGRAYGITLKDQFAYVADLEGGLQIINITDPYQAEIIGSCDTGYMAINVAVAGDTAYVAAGNDGLRIIDISDPSAPLPVGTMETLTPFQIKIVGETAYVTNGDGVSDDLQILDLSDPHHPVIVNSVNVSDVHGTGALGITVAGNSIYMADISGGIKVLDISVPQDPVLLGFIDTSGEANDIAIAGGRAYIANGKKGVAVTPVPVEIIPDTVTETTISLTLPGPEIAGHYTLNLFNGTERHEMRGAVTFSQVTRTSKAIILAGGGPSSGGYRNSLWDATQACANYAYRALLYQGHTRENVCYLTSDADFQVDGMYGNVDGPATYSGLSDAIRVWARNLEAPAHTLLLYLTDHGGDRSFRVNPDETITAGELDLWLDELQETMEGRVILIYDACQSGTFICGERDRDVCLSPLMGPPSGKERIVITSASDEPALFMPAGRMSGGLSFSFQFWAHIYYGAKLTDAFFFAKDMMDRFQTPLLDADGNGLGNEYEDRKAASVIFIGRGYQPASDIPLIEDVCDEQTLNGETSAEIWAGPLRTENRITRIWAVLTPPGPVTASPDTPILGLPEVELEDADGDGIYEGVYDGFAVKGTYYIAIYAIDTKDIHALTQQTAVIQTVEKAGPECDVNRDGKTDLADAVTALQILTGTGPILTNPAVPALDGDGRIGLGEVIFILKKLAGD